MYIPTKAYTLSIENKHSQFYANQCIDSCRQVNLDVENFIGFCNITGQEAWNKTGIPNITWNDIDIDTRLFSKKTSKQDVINAAACATAGHAALWLKIANGKDNAAIVLEHDAIMLQPVEIEIPDNIIVTLGYKFINLTDYDHISAGRPKHIINVDGHHGAHAYAITRNTAKALVDEIIENGPMGYIDSTYFMKNRKTSVPIGLMLPTPSAGWIRRSTIWDQSSTYNYPFEQEFEKFYKASK